MSESPGEQSGKAKTDSEPNQKPREALLEAIRKWGFISALFLACCVGAWKYIEATIWSVYLIGVGFCVCVFLAIHKEGILSTTVRCKNIIAVVVSLIIMICAGLFSGSQNRTEIATWQPPEIPEGYTNLTVQLSRNGAFIANFHIRDLQNKKVHFPAYFFAGPDGIVVIKTTGPNPPPQTNNFLPVFLRVEDKRLWIDVTLPYRDRTISVSGNKPRQQIPPAWDWNASENAFEIVNEHKQPMFQLIYVRPEVVHIRGMFGSDGSIMHVGDSMFIGYGGSDFIPALFKYPSGLHRGEYVENAK